VFSKYTASRSFGCSNDGRDRRAFVCPRDCSGRRQSLVGIAVAEWHGADRRLARLRAICGSSVATNGGPLGARPCRSQRLQLCVRFRHGTIAVGGTSSRHLIPPSIMPVSTRVPPNRYRQAFKAALIPGLARGLSIALIALVGGAIGLPGPGPCRVSRADRIKNLLSVWGGRSCWSRSVVVGALWRRLHSRTATSGGSGVLRCSPST